MQILNIKYHKMKYKIYGNIIIVNNLKFKNNKI